MGNPGTAVASAPAPAPAPARPNHLLVMGGYFSLAFAIFQVSAIWWPPNVMVYFGGPVKLQTTRPIFYAVLCIVVGLIAAVFGWYALSGAGKIRRLPLLRAALIAITAIYLLRGLQLIADIIIIQKYPGKGQVHFAVFSAIALAVGLVHLGGTIALFKSGRRAQVS